jgi:transposase
LVRDRNSPQKVVWRARIVLLAGNGMGALEVAAEVGTSVLTVRRLRRRYSDKGVAGLLKDSTRPARKKPLSAQTINRIVNMTLHEKSPKATHWSLRSLAKTSGVSPSSVQRIWKAHGLKPHLVRTFKLSRDPKFSEKVADVVGLYLNPPAPGLPMKKGRAGTMTHDYKRHVTTTLFAALDVASGKVIGECMERHRHQEFLRFLRTIDRNTPKSLDLHLLIYIGN